MNKLEIDYFISNGKIHRIFQTEFTESDLHEWLQAKFENGDLPCPINLNREDFHVENVTVTKVEL